MKRREFLTKTLAATTVASLSSVTLNAGAAGTTREYYELRIYRLKPGASHELLDTYLEKAAIPAWNRLGIKPVGVFTEVQPKGDPSIYVLIPHPSIDSFVTAAARLNADAEYQKAAAEYLQSAKTNPAFERIDSSLLLAFAGMPKLEQPACSREKTPRIFELRTYQSHSELKALKKIDMFNAGEIDTMREVGMGPIFYGQCLVGSGLPHLVYMLSAENEQARGKHWEIFSKHPVWLKLKDDPQYADTVSKIDFVILKSLAGSQI
jgi:hypothetical protein